MPFARVIPALADLTQDIAGPIPLELLHNWASANQDLSAAESVLEGFQIEGTAVATDSSGLSLMTKAMELLDVLLLVSQPKEIVHGLGTEVGGRAIGVWVADNSEMFYPAGVDVGLVVDAMHEARARIDAAFPIRLGFCIHRGVFYEIGGGLYGEEAAAVEYLAEEHAGPGEMLVTEAAAESLRGRPGLHFARREDLSEVYAAGVHTLRSDRRLPDLRCVNTRYPHPFPEEFYRLFSRLATEGDPEGLKRRIYQQYQRERAVLVVAREQLRAESDSLAAMLDDLLLNALADTIVRESIRGRDSLSTSGGGLGILTFESVAEALECALELRARFARNGLLVRMGIDRGPLLLFESTQGGRCGLTGDPVNTSSKLAENLGIAGRIHVTSRAAATLPSLPVAEPFDAVISKVEVMGFIV